MLQLGSKRCRLLGSQSRTQNSQFSRFASAAQQESFPRDSRKATHMLSRRQLLSSLSSGACLPSCLLLRLQGWVLGMGVCSWYFKALCRNFSSKASWGMVFHAVTGWLEQPSAHLCGTGLLPPMFPPTYPSFWVCGLLPLGHISCFLCFIQCMFRMKYRQTRREGAGPQTLDCPVSI